MAMLMMAVFKTTPNLDSCTTTFGCAENHEERQAAAQK